MSLRTCQRTASAKPPSRAVASLCSGCPPTTPRDGADKKGGHPADPDDTLAVVDATPLWHSGSGGAIPQHFRQGGDVITIRITNAEEVVENQSGWFAAHIGGVFVDLHEKVEDVVAERIRASLSAEGVDAVIERVPEG